MSPDQRDSIRSLWRYLDQNVPYNVEYVALVFELGDIEDNFSSNSSTGMLIRLVGQFEKPISLFENHSLSP